MTQYIKIRLLGMLWTLDTYCCLKNKNKIHY